MDSTRQGARGMDAVQPIASASGVQPPAPALPAPAGLLGRHRGWAVVAGCFIVLFSAFGASYSFGPLFNAFSTTFGASRAEVSGVFALAGLLYFLVGLPAGLAADRFGTRAVAVPGALLLGIGLWGASRAQTLTELLWLYALALGFGVGLVYAPSVGAVQPWFQRRRGLASGLAVAGIGTGTLVVPPLVAWLAEAQGWRAALAWMGLGLGVPALIGALLLDNRPQRHGLGPDGVSVPRVTGSSARAASSGTGLLAAVRGPGFGWLYLTVFLFCMTAFLPFVHLVPSAMDAGIPAARAATLIALIGAGSMAGRFAVGGFADRFGRQRSLAAAYAVLGLASLAWWVDRSFAVLAVFALVHGTAYGVSVALFPSIAMDWFGARNLAGLIGLLYTAAGFGSVVGPMGAGWWYDRSGSYDLAIVLSAAASLVAAVVTLRLRPPARP